MGTLAHQQAVDIVKNELQTSNKSNRKGHVQHWLSDALRHGDMKGATGDVLFPPLHSQNVIAPLLDDVGDVVLLLAHMLHGDLFTGVVGPWTPINSMLDPALLQSTRKELFWPTKAFDRPAPLEVTLLASEDDLGMAL